jgi:hypothetical protein
VSMASAIFMSTHSFSLAGDNSGDAVTSSFEIHRDSCFQTAKKRPAHYLTTASEQGLLTTVVDDNAVRRHERGCDGSRGNPRGQRVSETR